MQLLTLPATPALATSIRATAQVFENPASKALLAHLQQIAPSDASVLIIGETGTGKELVARHIHQLSHRQNQPFVAVNCGAFAESLVEAELFGHEKGAFTGALTSKAGWFEEADGGTLFLDEIGDLPLTIQVKLLRVLQEQEVVRLGSRKSTPINVRVLAATNVNLEQAIDAGHFREDLYYRLNVVSLGLLPLRERPGDILPLARHFLKTYRQRLPHGPTSLSECAEQVLIHHPWQGNIRELKMSRITACCCAAIRPSRCKTCACHNHVADVRISRCSNPPHTPPGTCCNAPFENCSKRSRAPCMKPLKTPCCARPMSFAITTRYTLQNCWV